MSNGETTMGLESAFRDVLAFHRATGSHVGTTPEFPPEDVAGLRWRLIREEVSELESAVFARDLPEIADAAIDLIYVTLGTLVSCGIDPGPVWDAVQAANLQKANGPKRADGKILKGPDFKHPDIAAILAKQGPIGGVACA